ncbi:peptidylprolyl isomerase [Chamaesiphon sp. VAR_48_metabat_135_sub]|uniref:peptidylprolyl isomerase n=1 Tax=Chamaesiphon sp. VAR_48_metabat_135_sub TaxID=2964699 RepID=UPI00286D0E2B|nr:peptidylprolyl isomerase [Chamaesiphon sp. VAR_48_metabat_135_sub]
MPTVGYANEQRHFGINIHTIMLSQVIDPLQLRSPTEDRALPVFRLGNNSIAVDRLLRELDEYQILPQLLQEIEIDRLVAQTALELAIDLNYSKSEFDRLSAQIDRTPLLCGMNSSQLKAIVDRELKLQKFKQANWGDLVEAAFHSQERQLDLVVISILTVSDSLMARELFFRIHSREQSFAEIALDYSEDRYANNGGILGPISMKTLAPEIGQVVINLQPGDLSCPFSIGEAHLILRLDELHPAQLDERTHQLLLDELFANWAKLQFSSQLN